MKVKVRMTFDRRKHEVHIQATEPIFPVLRIGTFHIEWRDAGGSYIWVRSSTDNISAHPASFMTFIRAIMAHHWVCGGSVTKRNVHIHLVESITTAMWHESIKAQVSLILHAYALQCGHDIRVSGEGKQGQTTA